MSTPRPPQHPQSVVCLLVHKNSPATRLLAATLEMACYKLRSRFAVLFDTTHNEPGDGWPPGSLWPFTYDKLAESGYILYQRGPNSFDCRDSCDVPLLAYAATQPAAKAYWRIEYDCRFTGDWATVLHDNQWPLADFLTFDVRLPTDEPTWAWWGSLKTPKPAGRFGAFAPIFRLSRAGLAAVEQARRSPEWGGHFEVLLPTCVAAHGLQLATYGPQWTTPDTFRYFPGVMPNADTHPNKLWHPVKQ